MASYRSEHNSQRHSPVARVSAPTSAQSSPNGSVLLPPVEIESSPVQSTSTNRLSDRHDGNRSSHQIHGLPQNSALKASGSSKNRIYPENSSQHMSGSFARKCVSINTEGLRDDNFEGDYIDMRVQERIMKRSASNISITIKKRGWFSRLRRSPNFILFTVFLALFIDMATYGIIVPILPFIISEKVHGGATDTGLLLAVYAVGILVSSPLFGVLGDYFVSRRVPMLIGLVGMVISTILFMLASNFYVFLMARLLQGVAGGSVWTLGLALITDVFPAHTLGVQMGKALIGYTLGLMMGPPLGGFLYDKGGYQAPFLFCCIITLIDFGCRALIVEEREEYVKALREQGLKDEATEEEAVLVAARRKERMDERTSFLKLLKNKRLFGCIVVTACNAFAFSGAEPTVPLYLAKTFDLTSERIGFVFMAFSLPTLTAPLSGYLSDKFGARSVTLISLVLCGGTILFTGFFAGQSLTMIIMLFAVIGTTGTAVLTPVLGELSAVVRATGDGDGFARAYAMFNMAFSIGVLVGPIVCGILYERHGFVGLSIAMGGSMFVALPFGMLCLGGSAQKKRDLALYKEQEEMRARQLGQEKRFSIDDEEMNKQLSPSRDGQAQKCCKNNSDEKEGRSISGLNRGDEILKSARLDE